MLTEKEAQYIAHLSRIDICETEARALTEDLVQILTYIEKLKKINIENVKPTTHVLPLKNIFQEDHVLPSLDQIDIMNMPLEKANGYFKVPQIIR